MKIQISKEELYRLYVKENKTDKEIALLFSTNIYSINKLRKKYEIKGINARHRKLIDNPQKELTQRQKDIIMGSLLGDACLKIQSKQIKYNKASLSISHSIKQKGYVDWLYSELKSICNAEPKSYVSKGKYTTYWFISESREDLAQIRKNIYVPQKTVNKEWLNSITDLGLAIWYMDDGSLSYVNKSRSVFSFATNSFSLEENHMLAEMLKSKFDINAEIKTYGKKTGIQYNVYISDDSFEKFTNIISPYIVDCMKYKMPCDLNKKHWSNNIERKIDKKTLSKLYNDELYTQTQIAQILNVHKSTVIKYMDIFGIRARNNKDAQMHGKNNKCKRDNCGQFVSLQITEEQEKKAQEIFKQMRGSSFPYIAIKQNEYYLGVLDRLCNDFVLPINNGISDVYSRSGIDICSAYCPQIFNMSSKGSLSPMEIFNDDKKLLDCIKRTIKYAKRETIGSVRQGLKTYKKNRCVTVFPPMWAKTLIKCFSKDKDNLSVLDFSSGFGGRLIGSYASGKVVKYIGIDPLGANFKSNNNIGEIIKQHAALKNKTFEVELIKNTAETALNNIKQTVDIVITSPPYFDKECYSNDFSQCYKKYNNYDIWKKEWLQEVLKVSYEKLVCGGHMMIFASDYGNVKVGSDCCDIMRKIGREEPCCIKFGLPTLEYLRRKGQKKYDTAWIIQKK